METKLAVALNPGQPLSGRLVVCLPVPTCTYQPGATED